MTEREREPLLREFGAAVRTRRIEAGISQEDLAFKAGMDRTYLSGIERGLRNPSLRNIGRLSQALNISISELFRDIITSMDADNE